MQDDPQRSYFRQNTSSSALELPAATVPSGAWVRADLLVGARSTLLGQFAPPVKAGRLPDPLRADALAGEPVLFSAPTFDVDPAAFAVVAVGDYCSTWPPVRPDLVV